MNTGNTESKYVSRKIVRWRREFVYLHFLERLVEFYRIEIFLSIIEFSKVVKINTVFDTAGMKLTNNRQFRDKIVYESYIFRVVSISQERNPPNSPRSKVNRI